jgi:hypothetical protein
MSKTYKIIYYILLTAILAWLLPWLYNLATLKRERTPFALYSEIIEDFAMINVNQNEKDLRYTDRKGNFYTEMQFDSILPMFYYRQLVTDNRLPDTVQGVPITAPKIRRENFIFRSRPADINVHNPKLYPLLESRSKRVDLTMPDDVFRLTKNDPDLTPKMDTYKATYNRMQVSGNWIWRVAKPWLNSLEHSISYDYTQDVTSRMLTVSPNGVVPLPTAETDGEHEGVYLPAEYFTSYKMTGVPTAFFSQLKGKNIFSSGKNIYHVLNWGGQYRHEKNRGKGFEYDLLRPPYPTSSTSSRPRRFNEIPALQNLSVYIEDKVSASFGKNNMELIAGVRFTHMPGIGNRFVDLHQKWFPEPRINGWWQLSNFQCLGKTTVIALKGGYGEAIKFPTLDMLHPEPDYLDHISLNYYSQKQANALLWITTKTNERSNPALKPNRNRKAELGLNIQVGKSKLNVLCFYEKSSEGFQYNTHYYWYEVNKYRSDILFDYKPQISEFQVYKDSLLDVYSVPVNGEKVIKKGVEYMFSTPVIKPLATSILVNGAYYQTVYDESLPIMSRPSIIQNGKPYRYVGVYGWNRGKTQSRFNTNVWFNTHLKKYRLIFTTKLQSLWFTHYTTLPFSGVPIAYFGVGMDKPQEFTEADKNDPTLRFLVQEFSSSFFKTTKQPLQIGIDLKATKEITGELRMSFYVNRLMFCSPLYYSNLNTPLKIRRTPYFGIEIEIKL